MSTLTTDPVAAIAAIEALLQPLCRSDAPGMIVGINQHGRPLYRRGLGLASLEQGVANTPHTRMRLASTSKHFTALAILLLAEDGKLQIDEPVQTYLPELPRLSAQGPTLRQLMAHTAGWRGHDELWSMANGLNVQPAGSSLAMMARQSELNFEPGTRMIYSNGGYHLLALTIARVSGLSFAEFLRSRIFEPLGMLDSESVPSVLDVREGLAGLYVQPPGTPAPARAPWRRALYPTEFEGSGSLVSSLGDMLIWLSHLRSEHKIVGSAQSWQQMLTLNTLSSGEVLPYGFGLCRQPYRGVEVIHHNGAVTGGGSQMITVPAHALDIVIMTNGCAAAPAAIALKLIDLLLAEHLPETVEASEPRAAASDFPGLIGKRYYEPQSGRLMQFGEVAQFLGLSLHGFHALPLRRRGDAVWLGMLDMATSAFEVELAGVDPAQAPQTLAVREGGQMQHFQRLSDEAPAAAAIAPQLIGRYRSADLDADAVIALEGQTLMLTIQGRHGQMQARVQPASPDVVTLIPIDPMLAALTRSVVLNLDRRDGQSGQVLGLRLDSVRTRHLRFVRVD
ncbi:serine hydrolase [Paucibacter sp. PLA-PC-4]|uniref:serine hydrolase domain-containing protein n=1 Tax=Paucibacter sp. PLA-PC-4 TaxID=2993655 RepID=UPI00224B8CDE|nr:serine hydrolase domain-containing protein [Paucibacter sp. PLA-PC-4]MCX2865481.1 serine hydrolase [Paucibacter sp. PLA-PC-4]